MHRSHHTNEISISGDEDWSAGLLERLRSDSDLQAGWNLTRLLHFTLRSRADAPPSGQRGGVSLGSSSQRRPPLSPQPSVPAVMVSSSALPRLVFLSHPSAPVLPLGCCSHSSHLLSLPLASCGTVSLFGAPAPSSLSLQPLALLPCSICNTVTKLSLRHTSDGFSQFLHHTLESFSRFFDSTKHVLFSLSLHACARPTFLWFINGTIYL